MDIGPSRAVLTTLKSETYKPRVLVVDDDRFMLSLVGRLLSAKGYHVLQADHGEDAVDIASREPLDLILLDLLLPGEDGYAVCRRIKALPLNASVPVIFLTGMRGDQEMLEGLAAGGVDYVVKPFEPAVLLARVKTHTELAILSRSARNSPTDPASERLASFGDRPQTDPNGPLIDIHVQTEPFDMAAEQKSMWEGHSQVGALVTFIGLMRDMNDGDRTNRMTLEHYPGMTEKALDAIAEEAAQRWQVQGIRIVHRVGHLKPQDPIVLVAVTASHRAEAFRACELLIDYLKTRAPFWKKENTDKGERWVEARTTDDDAAQRWKR